MEDLLSQGKGCRVIRFIGMLREQECFRGSRFMAHLRAKLCHLAQRTEHMIAHPEMKPKNLFGRMTLQCYSRSPNRSK